MQLDKIEIELIQGIRRKLKQGDIQKIAQKTNLHRSYVSGVLNMTSNYYNENVIAEAVDLISTREQGNKKLLKVLISENPE